MSHSLSGSLGRVVRRVLRTQRCRTSFETRVLEMARELADSHCGEVTRERLAGMIVERLMAKPQVSPNLLDASNVASPRFVTQVHMPDSTFAI